MENNFFYIGEDLGMGANKLYGSSGGLQFLSQVASNGSQHLSGVIGLRQLLRPLEIKTQHGSFYTGEGAHDYGRPVENLDFDRLTGSPEMMALFYGSITRYQHQHGAITQPIVMMGGLPLQMMSGDTAKEYANQVRARFKGTHQWLADGKAEQIQIAEVKLIPQPVAALFDYVLDDKGKFIPEYAGLLKQEVGILSVGFNTLELGELDSSLRAGRLDIANALPVWAREVNGEIEKRWGMAFKRFARVIVVGGGALLLKEHLTRQFNGKAVLPDNPVMSIARGLYKLLLMKR